MIPTVQDGWRYPSWIEHSEPRERDESPAEPQKQDTPASPRVPVQLPLPLTEENRREQS